MLIAAVRAGWIAMVAALLWLWSGDLALAITVWCWMLAIALLGGIPTTHPDTAKGGTVAPPFAPQSQRRLQPASTHAQRSRLVQSTTNPGRTPAPTRGQITHLVHRVMVAASGHARGEITDATEARIAQLEQENHGLGELHAAALDEVESLRAQLLRERTTSADLLERNAALRDGAPALVNETIRLRAEVAHLGDRLGDYAGERWPHCPNCAGVEMAVTDGGETLECVA